MIELLFQRIIMNKSILIVGALAFLLFLGCSQETTAPSKNEPNSTNNEMANFSCKTESLLDSSGIKIICGGDSIGVVFNGSNGTKGADGEDGKDGKDGKDGVDGTNGTDGKDGTSCTIIPLESIDAHKLMCDGDSVGTLYNGINGVDGIDGKDGINGIDGKDGKDGINGLDGTGCTSTAVTDELTGKSGVQIQCGEGEPLYIWNGKDGVDGEDGTDGINGIDGKDGINGTNGADGVSCYVQENADLTGFDVYCGGVKVGTLQNGQDGINGTDGKDGVDGTGCTSTAVIDSVTGKSGVRVQCGDAEPVYVWDGADGVTNKVEELSEQCLAIRATKNDFIPITDIFPCVRSNEKVAFIIRHAARDRDASGSLASLNSEGRSQSLELGERLSATGDFFYMHTHYYRNMETVMLMAQGKGQTIPDSASLYSVIEDEYHLQTQDLLESWFVKDETKVDACKSPQSWGWSAYSKFAYEEENLTACQAAFYDVDDRVQDFIAKYFTYEQMHDMTMAISHDRFVVPFLVSISDRQLDLRFHNHENDFNYWINYLTGVAIIVDPDNQVTIIPVKSLDDAYLRVF